MNIPFVKICLLLLILFTTHSCTIKEKCKIEPISKNIIDSKKNPKKIIFINQNNEKDSLLLLDSFDTLRNESISGITNRKECGHFIGYNYAFRNESIGFKIDKNENKIELSFDGFCFYKDLEFNNIGDIKDSLIIINSEKDCHYDSDFKSVAFRNFKIEYFITKNGDLWKQKEIQNIKK